MKQTFDYLENVAFAATVCDKEGIVLNMPLAVVVGAASSSGIIFLQAGH